MKEIVVIRTGVSKDGSFWAMVQEEIQGFILTGWLRRNSEEFKEGVIQIPSVVYNAIKWES